MSELKPCPFCGGEAEISLFLGNYHVACTECLGAIFPCRGMLEEEAIEAWNTRADVPETNVGEIRAKAIDEFAKKLKIDLTWQLPLNYADRQPFFALENLIVTIDEIAEQLKGGVSDGIN